MATTVDVSTFTVDGERARVALVLRSASGDPVAAVDLTSDEAFQLARRLGVEATTADLLDHLDGR